MANEKVEIVVLEGVVCFPAVFQPEEPMAGMQGEPKYGVELVIDPNALKNLEFFKAQCEKAIRNKLGKVPTGWKLPLKKGDELNANREAVGKEPRKEIAGKLIARPRRMVKNGPPPVVDANSQPIIDQGQIYSGAICQVAVQPYYSTRTENPGVFLSLMGVKKIADGERLGPTDPSVEEMFGSAPAPTATPSALDNLL